MSQFKFTPQQRFAIFTVHGEICYICRRPVDLTSMQVDHVIPESLLGVPARLQKVLRDLGRPSGFDVNGYENWLPACGRCNGLKDDNIWDPSLLVQLCLQIAKSRAEKVRELVERQLHRSQISRALNTLERANVQGALSPQAAQHLVPLLEIQRQYREVPLRDDPVVVTQELAVRLERPVIRVVRAMSALLRRKLISEYNFSCAITGPADPGVLEIAALGSMQQLNEDGLAESPKSYLVLRADIHHYFDSCQIAIDPVTTRILVSKEARSPDLAKYNGCNAFLPSNIEFRPDPVLLARHLQRLKRPLLDESE